MKTTRLFAALGLAALALVSPAAAQHKEFESLKIDQTIQPVFPDNLIKSHPKGGQARVLISVSARGELEDYLVIGYTHRGFAEELVSVVKRWKFEPARTFNEPIASTMEIITNFEATGVVTDLLPMDVVAQVTATAFSSPEVYRPRRPSELDRVPALLEVVQPAYSKDMYDQGMTGEVTIEFYIDEQGNVRMPSALATTNISLAAIAGQAVRQWKFEPPTAQGQPALVQVRQKFIFDESSLKAPAKK